MKNLVVLVICAMCALTMSGCSLLGGCEAEPVLALQSPLRFSMQTRPTELPPARQSAVFAAPVAMATAPAAGYYGAAEACPVPYNPAPQPPPLFGTREK